MPDIDILLARLKNNDETLDSLDFMDEDLDHEDIKRLIEALKNNRTLLELSLASNRLNVDSAYQLSELLGANTGIQMLELYDNNLGPEGIKALIPGLKQNRTLTYLGLMRNKIDDASVACLVDALHGHLHLHELDLRSNHIGSNGAFHLASYLSRRPSLAALQLGGNQIDDEGACALALALNQNSALKVLDVSNNQLTAMGEFTLLQVGCSSNGVLEILNIDNDRYYHESLKTEMDPLIYSMVELSLSDNYTLCKLGRDSGRGIQLLEVNRYLQSKLALFVTEETLNYYACYDALLKMVKRVRDTNMPLLSNGKEYVRLFVALALRDIQKEIQVSFLLQKPFSNPYLQQIADIGLREPVREPCINKIESVSHAQQLMKLLQLEKEILNDLFTLCQHECFDEIRPPNASFLEHLNHTMFAPKSGSSGIPVVCSNKEQSTLCGLSAESSDLARFMGPVDTPRDVEFR